MNVVRTTEPEPTDKSASSETEPALNQPKQKRSIATAIVTDSQFLVPFGVMVVGIILLIVLH
jgi:hypothetical protein